MPQKDPREPFTRITVQEAKEMMERGDIQVIDVREPNEYREGHIPGAKLMPVNSVLTRIQELNLEVVKIAYEGVTKDERE